MRKITEYTATAAAAAALGVLWLFEHRPNGPTALTMAADMQHALQVTSKTLLVATVRH